MRRGAPALKPRGTMNHTAVSTGPSGTVTLFVLLARPAPARVVAADLLGRLDAALLDDRCLLDGLGRVPVGADRGVARRLGEPARRRGRAGARVAHLAAARRAAGRA